jgi:hypothetical protein
MFGNRLGWGISAVLTLGVLALVWQLARLNAISAPSQGIVSRTGNVALNLATSPQKLEPLALPFNPQSILPSMTDSASPAAIYAEAIEYYKANPEAYRTPELNDGKVQKGFDALLRARNCRPSTVFAGKLDKLIGYKVGDNDPYEDIEALFAVGKAASNAALRASPSDSADALALAEAVFSLGVKLFDERLRFREMDAGAELIGDGAYLIGKLDPARASAVAPVKDGMKKLLSERAFPVWTVISSIDPNVVGRTGGDVFYLAKHSKERLWRIEAILKLGRLKHDQGEGGRGADGRAAVIAVRKMANDASLDPALRTAAQRANDLTVEQHRLLGG